MVDTLTPAARDKGLQSLDGWSLDATGDAITRTVKFKGFGEAFAFMTRVALEAEKAGHHPDWSNSYDSVTMTLSTHDAGGLSAKDLALAQAINAILG